MRIAAIDPGKTSGMAVVYEKEDKLSWDNICEVTQDFVWRTLDNYHPEIVVIERFVNFKGQTNLEAVEVIGIAKEWCRQHDVGIVMQSKAQVDFFTDERLREANLYVKGMVHGRDAIRHALYYLKFTRKSPNHPVHNRREG